MIKSLIGARKMPGKKFPLCLVCTALLAFPSYGGSTPKGIVKVAKSTINGQTTYRYQVENNTAFPISQVVIGDSYLKGGDPTLKSTPSGWSVSTPNNGLTSPSEWTATVYGQEESDKVYIEWAPSLTQPDPTKFIQPGRSLTGFAVVLDAPDDSYINSSFTLILQGSTPVSAPLQEGTITSSPPTLSVQLTPGTLWPANNKMVGITAVLSALSDTGQQPTVKLLSVTCDDNCDPSKDIAGAQTGTNDRLFQVRSTRKGMSKAGRTYTVTYSATDSLGQTTQKSATIVVRHDQRTK